MSAEEEEGRKYLKNGLSRSFLSNVNSPLRNNVEFSMIFVSGIAAMSIVLLIVVSLSQFVGWAVTTLVGWSVCGGWGIEQHEKNEIFIMIVVS